MNPLQPLDAHGLREHLAQLVDEPFRFLRVSYGDELTVHFGPFVPARSPKLAGEPFGAYILGTRGSPWTLEPGTGPAVSGVDLCGAAPGGGGRLDTAQKERIERTPFVQPDGTVVSALPFVDDARGFIGLRIAFSDRAVFTIVPPADDSEGCDEPGDGPSDDELLELADWELLCPGGLFSAGPGLRWEYAPERGPGDG